MAVTDDDTDGGSLSRSQSNPTTKEEQLSPPPLEGEEKVDVQAVEQPAAAPDDRQSEEKEGQQHGEEERKVSESGHSNVSSTCSGNSFEDEDFAGDELLAELLGGKHTQKVNSFAQQSSKSLEQQQAINEVDKSWKTLDSVHSRCSTFSTYENTSYNDTSNNDTSSATSTTEHNTRNNYFGANGRATSFGSSGNSGEFNDSAASFASFGDSCSSLSDSGMCDLKDSFQDIDDDTTPSSSPSRLLGNICYDVPSSFSSLSLSGGPGGGGGLGAAGGGGLGGGGPQSRPRFGRSMSARHVMKRGASFRGTLDLIKENSLH